MATDPAWSDYYREEMDAAWLYRILASRERDPIRKSIFERLVTVEDAHVERWRSLFQAQGRALPSHKPSFGSRGLAFAARVFGSSAVLPIIVRQETREVASYLRLARRSHQKAAHDTAMTLASESAQHAQSLSASLGREGEPWHATAASGYLRGVVYGFNDGLTANFGLVAGVLGANVEPRVILLTGVAGALADALSMGASGYLAAKSESEMAARQVAIEREEMRLMPDIEERELAIILEAKGLAPERAAEAAQAMMADPKQALETKVQEELGIPSPSVTPLADGLVTGSATAVGALIPLVPFFAMEPGGAIWASLTIAMLAHFLVGAARSVFTGRGVWRSGRDMFLVGFGVAAAGYLIGMLFTAT